MRKPLVIFAESGIGKTSLMSMVYKRIPEWFGSNAVQVIRFLGTSALSTDIYKVLYSVIGQLADHFQQILEPEGYKNMKTLVEYFPRFLRKISRLSKSEVFILLDSIDQLSPTDGAFTMKWLPLQLPSNIHLVLSTLPSLHGCLDNLRKENPEKECYIELKELPQKTGNEIVESYLRSKNRTLTKEQKELILKCLETTPSPLFLKLLLEKAKEWKSYTEVSKTQLVFTVREAINLLFKGMEEKFGSKLIQCALGYITIAYNGLSELELEDVLSCNNQVLDEIYQYHDPPVEGIIRIPTLLWARIRQDISEYIVMRHTYGKARMVWYHRQFIEAAHDRYIKGGAGNQLHTDLANLFLLDGECKCDITLTKRKKTILNADRQITIRKMTTQNKRKLETIPYHLIKCKNLQLLKSKALCNLNFMIKRMSAFSLNTLIEDYTLALSSGQNCCETDLELSKLKDFLVNAKPFLKKSDSSQ